MEDRQQHQTKQSWLRRHLPAIMLLLFVVQPVMDVLSFGLTECGVSNTVSLCLRFLVLFGTGALGFALSRHKKVYLALGGIVLIFAVLHGWACITAGYNGWQNPVYDLTNYMRVVQIPLFTLCFITFLRETGEDGYQTVERGFVINFGLIVLVEILSTVTGTDPHTYANKQIGVLGWFATTNAQSAILCAIVPVVVMQGMRKKKMGYLFASTIVGFGVLYLFATRLSYLAIFVTAAGTILVMLLSRTWNTRAAAVVLLGAVVCAAAIKVSPMYANQSAHQGILQQKQQEADQMIQTAEKQYHTTVNQSPEQCLTPLYEEYLGEMADRFGMQRVMQTYDYTTDVSELKDARRMKIVYCTYLMQDAGTAAKLFGLELQDMVWENRTFDVENDFHGIYYLYGIIGLTLFLLFLLYFAELIVRALLRNFQQYMTPEAGAFGISLCLLLLHVYCTAGVLRRPNASFYLSVVLAVIYYLITIRKYPAQSKT